MKIRELIKALQHIEASQGDIRVQLQGGVPVDLPENVTHVSYPEFWVVEEPHEDEGMIVNLRNWPY